MYPTDKIEIRKVRDFGQTIEVTLAFTKQNFEILLKSILMIALPPFIVFFAVGYFLIFFSFAANVIPTDVGDELLGNSFTGSFYLTLLSFFLITLGISTVIATIYQYRLLYIQAEDYRSITVTQVSKSVFSNLGLFIGSTIQLGIFVFFIFLFIPIFFISLLAAGSLALGGLLTMVYVLGFLYGSITLSMIYIVRVVEGGGFFAALSRCFYLVQENWWKTFFVIIITNFLAFSLIGLLSLLIGVTSFSLSTLAWNGTLIGSLIVVLQIIYSALQLLSSMLLFLVVAFNYFSLVEEKEGIGLLFKINQLKVNSHK